MGYVVVRRGEELGLPNPAERALLTGDTLFVEVKGALSSGNMLFGEEERRPLVPISAMLSGSRRRASGSVAPFGVFTDCSRCEDDSPGLDLRSLLMIVGLLVTREDRAIVGGGRSLVESLWEVGVDSLLTDVWRGVGRRYVRKHFCCTTNSFVPLESLYRRSINLGEVSTWVTYTEYAVFAETRLHDECHDYCPLLCLS